MILGQFGAIFLNFEPKHFFLKKSENVTFLDLFKANLIKTFVNDGQTGRMTEQVS